MQIDALSFIAPQREISLLPQAQQAAAGGRFSHWFADQLGQVNTQLTQADRSVQQLAAGGNANLHEVMMHLEQAKISLQLLMQVRTQVLEAYQEIMRSPV
jgi:flagellar hook-basal body complex protein FliE